MGKTGAGYKWSIRDGGQEEEWRHSVAPIPPEKIREIMAAEEEGEIEEADHDVGAVARDAVAGAGKKTGGKPYEMILCSSKFLARCRCAR